LTLRHWRTGTPRTGTPRTDWWCRRTHLHLTRPPTNIKAALPLPGGRVKDLSTFQVFYLSVLGLMWTNFIFFLARSLTFLCLYVGKNRDILLSLLHRSPLCFLGFVYLFFVTVVEIQLLSSTSRFLIASLALCCHWMRCTYIVYI
jgi:hypothetical protein